MVCLKICPKIFPLPQPPTGNWRRIRELVCEDLLPVLFPSPVSLIPLTSVCISFHTFQILHFDHKLHGDGVRAKHSHRPGCDWDIGGL